MEIVKSLLYKCISYPEDQVYDKFIEKLEDYIININMNNIKTVKQNKNKLKGDILEIMCLNLIKNNSLKIIK